MSTLVWYAGNTFKGEAEGVGRIGMQLGKIIEFGLILPQKR